MTTPPSLYCNRQNIGNEGVDDEEDGDNDNPEEDENYDSDSVDTTPENPLLDSNAVNDRGEQDVVMSDDDKTQGENDQPGGSTFNEEGLRRSTRQRRAPSSYIPSTQGNKYQYQGTVNINVST